MTTSSSINNVKEGIHKELERNVVSKIDYPPITDRGFQDFVNDFFLKRRRANTESGIELAEFQRFAKNYIHPNTPYRGLLLYYGLGAGKTRTAIGVMDPFLKAYVATPPVFERKNFNPIVILTPASLSENFLAELFKYMPNGFPEEVKARIAAIDFNEQNKKRYKQMRVALEPYVRILHYNANNFVDGMGTGRLEQQDLSGALVIIDEIHNVVSFMKNSIRDGSLRGRTVYNRLMNAQGVRIIGLSGTPVIDDPFEVAILTNLLVGPRPLVRTTPDGKETPLTDMYGIPIRDPLPFSLDYETFLTQYIDRGDNEEGIVRIKPTEELRFKWNLRGMVSYYGGFSDPGIYPTKREHPTIQVQMSNYQFYKYVEQRIREIDEEVRTARARGMNPNQSSLESTTSFRSASRQLCNFAFPHSIPRVTKRLAKERYIQELEEDANRIQDKIREYETRIRDGEASLKTIDAMIQEAQDQLDLVQNSSGVRPERIQEAEAKQAELQKKRTEYMQLISRTREKMVRRVYDKNNLERQIRQIRTYVKRSKELDTNDVESPMSSILRTERGSGDFEHYYAQMLARMLKDLFAEPSYLMDETTRAREYALSNLGIVGDSEKIHSGGARIKVKRFQEPTTPEETEEVIREYLEKRPLPPPEDLTRLPLLVQGERKTDIASDVDTESELTSIQYTLQVLSPKMYAMLERMKQILDDPFTCGNVVVYSYFNKVEGIRIFQEVLRTNGFEVVRNEDLDTIANTPYTQKPYEMPTHLKRYGRVVFWEGEERDKILDIFNRPENREGDLIRVIMITEAGAEGITVKNVRQLHIMEPYWNQMLTNQVVGRGMRTNSHRDLPQERRDIQVFRYLSVFSPEQKAQIELYKRNYMWSDREMLTTDEIITRIAERKYAVTQRIEGFLRETAVDCALNIEMNRRIEGMAGLQCFRAVPPEAGREMAVKYNRVRVFGPGRQPLTEGYIFFQESYTHPGTGRDLPAIGIYPEAAIHTGRSDRNRIGGFVQVEVNPTERYVRYVGRDGPVHAPEKGRTVQYVLTKQNGPWEFVLATDYFGK